MRSYLGTSNINNIAPWVHGAFTIDIMVTDSVPKGVFDAEAVRILSKRKYAPSEKGETGPKKAKFEFKI